MKRNIIFKKYTEIFVISSKHVICYQVLGHRIKEVKYAFKKGE